MIAHFTMDRGDFFALQSDAIKFHKVHKMKKIISAVLVFMLTLFSTLVQNSDLKYVLPFGLFLAILYSCLSPFLYTFITKLIIKFKFRGNKEIVKTHFGLGKCELELNEEGMVKKFEDLKEYIKWSQVISARQDEERYFLYTTDVMAFVIKKYPDNINTAESEAYNEFIVSSLDKKCITIQSKKTHAAQLA